MSMRCGAIAMKIGMSVVTNDDGSRIGVTLLEIKDCQVIEQKTVQKNGYNAVQIGTGAIKAKNVSKALKGHFAKNKVELKRRLLEFRVSEDALIPVGSSINVNHFVPGQFIDVQAVTIGKGFAGGMKKYGFRGLEASHGVSVSHRSIGSTGQRQDPGKVFKGKKMPGHMGAKNVTTQNLKIILTNLEKNILIVKGAVPGHKGGFVYIKDAVKKALPDNAPYPALIANQFVAEENSNEG